MVRRVDVRSSNINHQSDRGKHVCHFTVVHDPNDARILERQIRTLVGAGFTVAYIAKGQLTEQVEGCSHYALRSSGSNPMRRVGMQVRGWLRAIRLGPPIIVLHDPELLVFGLLVQLIPLKRQIIFDCHEDYSLKLREKATNRLRGRVLSYGFSSLAFLFGSVGGQFLAPTEHIRQKLGNKRTTLISNLPSKEMRRQVLSCLDARKHHALSRDEGAEVTFVYAGMISTERALPAWINCLEESGDLRKKILLAGPCAANAREWLDELSASGSVTYLGNLSVQRLPQLLTRADVGVVILPRTLTYELAHPSKLFEYLLSGLPIVLSDFEEWRKIVNMCAGVAFYCDPSDPSSIKFALREAATFSSEDLDQTRRERAILATEVFSWESDEKAYLSLFTSCISGKANTEGNSR